MTKNDTAKSLAELSPQGEWYGYASYIEGRTNGTGSNHDGDFKRHKTLGHAKSAVAPWFDGQQRKTAVYQWVGTLEDGYWVGVDA